MDEDGGTVGGPGDERSPYVVVTPDEDPQASRGWVRPLGIVAAIAVVGALVASQVYVVSTLDSTRDDLDAARAEITALTDEVTGVDRAVDELATDVDGLSEAVAADPGSAGPTDLPAGHLPPYVQGRADTAVGMTLGEVVGPDAYSGDVVTIDPADGTKRVWMVWAHWCPYCQEELPTLAGLHADLRSTYPDVEITTVTSSIDPERGNPLQPYLEAEQFPFAVIVDGDLTLATQLGANAFPFWVITDGDGTVLLRTTGYLDDQRVLGLVASLDEYEA